MKDKEHVSPAVMAYITGAFFPPSGCDRWNLHDDGGRPRLNHAISEVPLRNKLDWKFRRQTDQGHDSKDDFSCQEAAPCQLEKNKKTFVL